jgi:lipopolysaccharide transport system ATP-binding protein
MKPIVEVKGLWKEYQRGAQKEKYLSLRDNLFKSFKPSAKKESFWALEDINFEVYPGDSLAIIGKNGAGKSTLLKILSKITPPTKGEITLRGRLASLLEVGTGFHPELTGRENIYLNGSILGLGRQEINRQFDAIVDFSGVEAFLDTPLKHYSSGMQLRLAFAVAAHLEPEILVIDEVLAVGDHDFQKKCLGRMNEVVNEGRTVIFVSHNLAAMKALCNEGILLKSGRSNLKTDITSALKSYMTVQNDNRSVFSGKGIISKVEIIKEDQITRVSGDSLIIEATINTAKPLSYPILGVVIKDEMDKNLVGINNRHYLNENIVSYPVNSGTLVVTIEKLYLMPGKYSVDIFLGDRNVDIETVENAVFFNVSEENILGTSRLPNKELNFAFLPDVSWKYKT